MTTAERTERKRLAAEREARIRASQAEAQKAEETNCCPLCGRGVRRNLALTGWVQCEQHGDGHFRKDPAAPRCSWQGFTHG